MIGAEAEVEHQEEQPQEEEYVDEEQDQDQELTDFYNTQGKHRFIYPSILHKFKFTQAPVHNKPSTIYN